MSTDVAPRFDRPMVARPAWGLSKLKYVASIEGGCTPSKTNPDYWSGELPWVSPKDMKVRVIRDAEDHVSEEAIRDTSLRLIAPPVILVVVRGMILAHTLPVALTAAPVTINQDMKALRPRSGVLTEYLAYFLEGTADFILSTLVEESAHGTKCLRADLWQDLSVLTPPLAEQRRIAAFLDRETARIDALIERKRRQIELLHEKRAALISHAVTKGMDPSATMKDSGIDWAGRVPAHWQVIRIGLLCAVGNGSTPNKENPEYWSEGVYPWLTSGKINEEIIDAADQAVSESAFRECHLPWVRPQSVLLAITGEGQTRGRAALLRSAATISQHLAYATPRNARLRAAFLWRALQAQYEWLRMESSGVGSTRAALTCEFIRTVKIPLPPIDEQEAVTAFIARQAQAIDQLVTKVNLSIDRLREYRSALITAAVTGKIDLRQEAA